MVYTSGLWLFILSALILTVLILLTWRRRNIGAGRAFLFLMFCALIWTVAFTLEISAQGRELKLLMCKLQFLAIAMIPVAWVYLVLSYIGRSKRRLFWILLSIPPVLTNLIVWFVPRPNWFWGHPVMVYDQAPFPVMNYDYGPWFYYVHAAYGYVLLITALYILVRTFVTTHSVYSRQVGLMIIAILLPAVTDVLYVLGYSPIKHYNYTTAVFTVSCAIIAWSLFRYRFLDLLPLARDTVIENMDDGVIVLDAKCRLVDANPAARSIAGLPENFVGLPIDEILDGDLRRAYDTASNSENLRADCEIGPEGKKIYDIRLSPIRDHLSQVRGDVVTLRDITEQVLLFRQVQDLARHDGLTGIFNRRYLFELGERELARIKRNPESVMSVIIIDLDDFKTINDTRGHSAGDRVLRAVAETCLSCMRQNDIVGRLGGDEFAVIMPDTPVEQAMKTARRIHSEIAGLRIPFDGHTLSCTMSIGVASSRILASPDHGLDELFSHADNVMYKAKKFGKNQVISIE